MSARRSKNKKNGKSKKQPKVGRMMTRDHQDKYAKDGMFAKPRDKK